MKNKDAMKKIATLSDDMYSHLGMTNYIDDELRNLLGIPKNKKIMVGDAIVYIGTHSSVKDVFVYERGNTKVFYVVMNPMDEETAFCYYITFPVCSVCTFWDVLGEDMENIVRHINRHGRMYREGKEPLTINDFKDGDTVYELFPETSRILERTVKHVTKKWSGGKVCVEPLKEERGGTDFHELHNIKENYLVKWSSKTETLLFKTREDAENYAKDLKEYLEQWLGAVNAVLAKKCSLEQLNDLRNIFSLQYVSSVADYPSEDGYITVMKKDGKMEGCAFKKQEYSLFGNGRIVKDIVGWRDFRRI